MTHACSSRHAAHRRHPSRRQDLATAARDHRRTRRRVLPPRPGGPARSHASWTPELEAELCELAEQHGRTAGAIRSRPIELCCDIDSPGQTCTPEFKVRIDAEYAAAHA